MLLSIFLSLFIFIIISAIIKSRRRQGDCGGKDGDGELYQDTGVEEEAPVHRGRLQPRPHLHLGPGDRDGLPLGEPGVNVPQQAGGRPQLAGEKAQGGFSFHGHRLDCNSEMGCVSSSSSY